MNVQATGTCGVERSGLRVLIKDLDRIRVNALASRVNAIDPYEILRYPNPSTALPVTPESALDSPPESPE